MEAVGCCSHSGWSQAIFATVCMLSESAIPESSEASRCPSRGPSHFSIGARQIWFGVGLVGCVALIVGGATYLRLPRRQLSNISFAPLFKGLENCSRHVSTASPIAQQYFDQGLAFLYGFNPDEARRSFRACAANDPHCAMAFWGIAATYAPNFKLPDVRPAEASAALEAVHRAHDLSNDASPIEGSLIAAMAERFGDPVDSHRPQLNAAYAKAMQSVAAKYPDDPDVLALTAEALLQMRPWDQWTRDGKPQPGTEETIRLLTRTLRLNPNHIFGLHLLIHAVEASPHPEIADGAAEKLRNCAPILGHLAHMPSHIDVRRGRWHLAIKANERAIEGDEAYFRIAPRTGVYIDLIHHNRKLLAYAAMMEGQEVQATRASREMLANISNEDMRNLGPVYELLFAPMPYEVHIRFGRWDKMLSEPNPHGAFSISTAFWRLGRGIAYVAKKQIRSAIDEQVALKEIYSKMRKDESWRGRAAKVLAVGERMLTGEILYRTGKVDDAILALREGVRLEDNLAYAEPPIWVLPVRHALGATLLDAQRYYDAGVVYQQDLERWPNNGWSLYGLSRSLQKQGKQAEAAGVAEHCGKAWQYADFRLSSSCCCLPSKEN